MRTIGIIQNLECREDQFLRLSAEESNSAVADRWAAVSIANSEAKRSSNKSGVASLEDSNRSNIEVVASSKDNNSNFHPLLTALARYA
jgi:hypothetical protein